MSDKIASGIIPENSASTTYPSAGGYQCGRCASWVPYGTSHSCWTTPSPAMPPYVHVPWPLVIEELQMGEDGVYRPTGKAWKISGVGNIGAPRIG